MPIYAYKCSACGHAQDVLQKMSDPLLTVCPECGESAYVKQVTAAGFQLKGSGWYVTDFRNNGAAASGKAATPADGPSGGATSATSDTAGPAATATTAATPAAPASAPAAPPSGNAAS